MLWEHGRVLELDYSSNPGCCVRMYAGGPPHQCGAPEAAAIVWRYTHPRPHETRLYVCARRAEHAPDAEPLTGRDRAIIRARHRDRRARLERAGRLDLIVDR